MNAGTIIILVILAAIVVIALISSRKHMKGEGDCCGSGTDKPEAKKLDGKIIAKKMIHIEGMHCQNSKNSVERQINRIDGAAAEVNLKKNLAVVMMTRPISDTELREVIERLEFKVTEIETEAV